MEAKEFKHEAASSARLRALNAALPFAGHAHQKQLAIMVKLMEIKEICRHYDAATAQLAKSDAAWRQKMISAIIPHVSESKRENLKTMLQIMEMQEVFVNFEKFKEMSEWTQM